MGPEEQSWSSVWPTEDRRWEEAGPRPESTSVQGRQSIGKGVLFF